MATSKTTGRRKSSKLKWVNLKLGEVASEHTVLEGEEKDDRVDLSEHLVRYNRYCGSYMMGTNGGATFEEMLRPMPGVRRDRPEQGEGEQSRTDLENVIGPSDDRVLVEDTSQIPARSIGLLKIIPENGAPRYGTAWLIGPRTLATAAHNLLHPEAGAAKSIKVGMAYDGDVAQGGWHRVTDAAYEDGWTSDLNPGSPLDFAVLKIEDRNVGETLGWFGFADYHDSKFGDLLVNLFGYPLDRRRFHMYGSVGRVRAVDEGRLYYDCDAGGGMSGGPVIARFGEQRIAVGVHVAGGFASNVGTRINNLAFKLFNDHREW